ncbi:hypothetical protein [Klebsiella oxytoca]|uniref:hypothetical protein n=1 Tax=Klebsiella oxytoca TaxID=571 RepID=UPI0021AB9C91|nr:hypothetical protein [Klebsiella oxytoca]
MNSVAQADAEAQTKSRQLTKTALHRTRLRFSYHKVFSVLVFYNRYRQPAPLLGFCRRSPTEKIEMDFSIFQFYGSREDREKIATIRKITTKEILRNWR